MKRGLLVKGVLCIDLIDRKLSVDPLYIIS